MPTGCPLLALSGHPAPAIQGPLSGVKRTSGALLVMSAYDPERTLGTAIAKGLLDHLVGSGEDRLRKPDAAQSAAATANCHSSWQILEVQIHADLIA
jgi:hypothetical protein